MPNRTTAGDGPVSLCLHTELQCVELYANGIVRSDAALIRKMEYGFSFDAGAGRLRLIRIEIESNKQIYFATRVDQINPTNCAIR